MLEYDKQEIYLEPSANLICILVVGLESSAWTLEEPSNGGWDWPPVLVDVEAPTTLGTGLHIK